MKLNNTTFYAVSVIATPTESNEDYVWVLTDVEACSTEYITKDQAAIFYKFGIQFLMPDEIENYDEFVEDILENFIEKEYVKEDKVEVIDILGESDVYMEKLKEKCIDVLKSTIRGMCVTDTNPVC